MTRCEEPFGGRLLTQRVAGRHPVARVGDGVDDQRGVDDHCGGRSLSSWVVCAIHAHFDAGIFTGAG